MQGIFAAQAATFATAANVALAALDGFVQVSVDGEVVARHPAGSFDEGLRLSPRTGHLVVVRPTRPDISMRIGVAIYHSPLR